MTVRWSLCLFLLWLIFPVFQRACLAFGSRQQRPPWHLWVLAGTQDVAVAGQAWLALWLVGFVARSAAAVSFATAVLFALTHAYLAADALLARRVGMRLYPPHLLLLRYASSFKSSASYLDLFVAIGLLVVSCAVVVAGGRMLAASGEPPIFDVWLLAASLAATAVAAAGRLSANAPLRHRLHNALFSAEAFTLSRLVQLRKVAPGELTSAAVRDALLPGAEEFVGLHPECPLLRSTRGFMGERLFALRETGSERPHVVVLFLESFRRRDVGFLGGLHGVTSHFDRLAKEGIVWSNFVANGILTWRAIVSSLYGVLPPLAYGSMHDILDVAMCGLPQRMAEAGYRPAFFKAGDLAFEDNGPFCAAHGFPEVFGDKDIAKAYPQATGTSWGRDDEFLMRFFVDWLAAKDAQRAPVFAAAFTVSNHHPCAPPAGFAAVPLPDVSDDHYRRYLHTLRYTDHCLGLLVDLLEERGLAEKTLLFVLGDHGQMFRNVGQHSEAQLHADEHEVPLLLVAPGRIDKPGIMPQVASQVDLLPTIMDLLNLRGKNHGLGQSLARQVARRQAYFSSPLYPEVSAVRTPELELVHIGATGESQLFDLRTDPVRSRSVASHQPERAATLGRQLADTNYWVSRLYEADRFDAGKNGRAANGQRAVSPPTSPRGWRSLQAKLADSAELDAQLCAGAVREALGSALPRRERLRYATLVCGAHRRVRPGGLSSLEHSELVSTATRLLPHSLDAWRAREAELTASPQPQDQKDALLLRACLGAPFSPAEILRLIELRWRARYRAVFGAPLEPEREELQRFDSRREELIQRQLSRARPRAPA